MVNSYSLITNASESNLEIYSNTWKIYEGVCSYQIYSLQPATLPKMSPVIDRVVFMQSIFKRLLPILLKTDFSPCFSVYIAFDFEHVNAKWSIKIERTGTAVEKLEGRVKILLCKQCYCSWMKELERKIHLHYNKKEKNLVSDWKFLNVVNFFKTSWLLTF